MSNGFVYVLTNKLMPGLVKVGKTSLSPNERAQQLSSGTGVPIAFDVVREYKCFNCHAAEQHAHVVLEATVGRPNGNREFFFGPVETVVLVLDRELSDFVTHSLEPNFDQFSNALIKANSQPGIAYGELRLLLRDTDVRRHIVISHKLQHILGVYVACCMNMRAEPEFIDVILDPQFKGSIMNSAFQTAEHWSDDAGGSVIAFVRSLN